MATEYASVMDLLEKTLIKDIIPREQKLITISSSATIEEAIKTLSENKILSVPVAAFNKDVIRQQYLGFVDMFDILSYVLKIYTEDKEVSGQEIRLHVWCQDIATLSHKGNQLSTVPVKFCTDMSKVNPFCSVNGEAALPQLLYILKKGIHRVAVVDSNEEVIGIVSQSNILQLVASHADLLGKMGSVPIKDINLGQKNKLFSVNSEVRAIHAFYQMMQNQVSAVAINDHNGALIGNLSISDLRGLTKENLTDLLLPVLEYIKKQNNGQVIEPITATYSSTFKDVVSLLAKTKAHRIWIMEDKSTKATGVVSLTDIMNVLDLRVYVDMQDHNEKVVQ